MNIVLLYSYRFDVLDSSQCYRGSSVKTNTNIFSEIQEGHFFLMGAMSLNSDLLIMRGMNAIFCLHESTYVHCGAFGMGETLAARLRSKCGR